MKIELNQLAKAAKAVCAVTAVSLSLAMTPAQAAKFGVRVVDDAGSPLAGVSVCIGMEGNYKQFGTDFTDANGQVMVDVPNVPLLVTVSKDRFSGVRISEPARSFNLIKEVKLKDGVPGPRCRAGSVLTDADAKMNPPTIVIQDLAVFEGSGNTVLSPTVSGEPNQYRVSGSNTFDDTSWRDFNNQIAIANGVSNNGRVFLQMRKVAGTSRAFIETRSKVLTVRVNN